MEGFMADGDTTQQMEEMQRHWDCLMMGRVAYEMIRGWASVPVEENPIAKFMNMVPKVVVSKSLKEAPWGKWEPARVVNEVDLEIQDQRARRGKDTAILGSGQLVQYLASHHLVDEFLLWVYPVAFGRGKAWAPSNGEVLKLKLVESRTFESGIVELRYSPVSG
jgi:dihydrofolate reductase